MFWKLYFTPESEIYYNYPKKYDFLLLEDIFMLPFFLAFWIYMLVGYNQDGPNLENVDQLNC